MQAARFPYLSDEFRLRRLTFWGRIFRVAPAFLKTLLDYLVSDVEWEIAKSGKLGELAGVRFMARWIEFFSRFHVQWSNILKAIRELLICELAKVDPLLGDEVTDAIRA